MVRSCDTIRIMQKAGGFSDFSISGGKLYFHCGTLTGDNYGHSDDYITLNEEDTKKFIKFIAGREDAAIEAIIYAMSIHAFTTSHIEKMFGYAGIKNFVREHVNVDGKGNKIYR